MNLSAASIERLLNMEHFRGSRPLQYNGAWATESGGEVAVLEDDVFKKESENSSWSEDADAIIEEPSKSGWMDLYERKRVIDLLSGVLPAKHKPRGNDTITNGGGQSLSLAQAQAI